MSPSARTFITLLLAAAGIQCWLIVGDGILGERRQLLALLIALIAAACLLVITPARLLALQLLDFLSSPSHRTRLLIALTLALAATLYLYTTARQLNRHFSPIIHDEHSYLLQSRMASTGRLWLQEHPLADFFDSFHLITRPVYASKYSPGAALFYALPLRLGLPHWLAPLLLSGASVGLLYLLLTHLLDGLSGLLGALMLPALTLFRRISIQSLSQAPMLVLVLAALLAYLHWRRTRSTPSMLLLGLAIGWSAITRPVDALCLAGPLALAVLFDLRRVDFNGARTRAILAGLLGLLPFLVLQLACNKAITGKFTDLPWSYYARNNDPYDTMGPPLTDPASRPNPKLAQKQAFIEDFTSRVSREHHARGKLRTLFEHRLQPTFEAALPHPLLLLLVPLAFLNLRAYNRWILPAYLAAFLLLYSQYTFFIAHYAVTVAPAAILLVLAGWHTLRQNLPFFDQALTLLGAAAILALTVASYPQLERAQADDEWMVPPLAPEVSRLLATLDKKPAIVLFTFNPETDDTHAEPVYNTDTAHPDDAPVIRAHDLGPERNPELFRYYANKSPDRHIYRYDRSKHGTAGALTYLGTAKELAK